MNNKLGILVYAINPKNNQEPIDLFTSFPKEENLFGRRKHLVESILNDSYVTWSGKRRKELVARAKRNEWAIYVSIVNIANCQKVA